jgi:uncharacterized protein (DUF952 family)
MGISDAGSAAAAGEAAAAAVDTKESKIHVSSMDRE